MVQNSFCDMTDEFEFWHAVICHIAGCLAGASVEAEVWHVLGRDVGEMKKPIFVLPQLLVELEVQIVNNGQLFGG